MTTSAAVLTARPAPARDDNPWLAHREVRPGARMRLFCFPCAGGGAMAYREWAAHAPEWLEVCPVQPPGREGRRHEAAFTDLHELVDAACEAIEPMLDRPFALLGHSLGGLVAWTVAQDLARHGDVPAHLLIAGTPAPHLPLGRAPLHRAPDEALLGYLRRLDGTPQELLDSPLLQRMYLPVLRADLTLLETYVHAREPALPCPVTVIGGDGDRHVDEAALDAWRDYTAEAFARRTVAGDHFFVRDRAEAVVGVVAEALAE